MSGYYIITSNLAGNLVLDVSGADFTKVITHRIHGSDNQLWTKQSTCGDLFYLVPKSNPTLKLAILDNKVVVNQYGTQLRANQEPGIYRAVSIESAETGYALEASGNGAQVAANQITPGGSNQQRFVFYNA